jgi:hypothetical protein
MKRRAFSGKERLNQVSRNPNARLLMARSSVTDECDIRHSQLAAYFFILASLK